MPATSIPPAFVLKKQTILQSLATPADEYTDLSPKGSVDAGIKDLIDKINRLEGVVTTSSCAGRISVFLEGNKTVYNTSNDDIHEEDGTDGSASVPGGKGRGGRWLFVSHDPVEVPSKQGEGDMPLMRLCGLSRGRCSRSHVDVSRTRFVRLQFEPMILHIMTASLHHADFILAAAIGAGFRESGVQSLKNLDNVNAFPQVAIRTSGLALGSLIGYKCDDKDGDEIQGIVDEDYLTILMGLANERYRANVERMQRFHDNLFRNEKPGVGWEERSARQERKRTAGLEKRRVLRSQRAMLELEGNLGTDVNEDPVFETSHFQTSLAL